MSPGTATGDPSVITTQDCAFTAGYNANMTISISGSTIALDDGTNVAKGTFKPSDRSFIATSTHVASAGSVKVTMTGTFDAAGRITGTYDWTIQTTDTGKTGGSPFTATKV
jgi:hypothetical protein